MDRVGKGAIWQQISNTLKRGRERERKTGRGGRACGRGGERVHKKSIASTTSRQLTSSEQVHDIH